MGWEAQGAYAEDQETGTGSKGCSKHAEDERRIGLRMLSPSGLGLPYTIGMETRIISPHESEMRIVRTDVVGGRPTTLVRVGGRPGGAPAYYLAYTRVGKAGAAVCDTAVTYLDTFLPWEDWDFQVGDNESMTARWVGIDSLSSDCMEMNSMQLNEAAWEWAVSTFLSIFGEEG